MTTEQVTTMKGTATSSLYSECASFRQQGMQAAITLLQQNNLAPTKSSVS